ncbi:hypothetical protein ACFL60_03665 [Candidatus Omnitrophota bacterium]
MNRDELYFHFANLGLVLIGLLSVQSILNPFVVIILISGTTAGFIFSWHMKNARLQHLDTFIGMLSLASVVIILGTLQDISITFHGLLRVFSIALVWLTLFQSFGLKTGKSYAMLQFIAVCLFISSVSLALEKESFYLSLLALFLFIFIFMMRLNLVCERKRKGSTIVGDQERIMSLWQQIKVGALMFIFVFMVAGLIYPFVPRFENLSLRWIPSALLGAQEQIPMLKILKSAPTTLKDNNKAKKEQLVDDGSKKRETSGYDSSPKEDRLKRKKEKEETTKRFRAKGFNEDIDPVNVKTLEIKTDKEEFSLDSQCQLYAEIKMIDGFIIPATRLVDWKATGTARVTINNNGVLIPKEAGSLTVSASYLGSFSNDIRIEIKPLSAPIKKKSWFYRFLVFFSWLFVVLLSVFLSWIFIRSRKLAELAIKNPREFIKEVYIALCKAFRTYGVHRFDYFVHREFFDSLKSLIGSKPEPMHFLTEGVLEARFSTHDISALHSEKVLGLFHEVKDVVLARDDGKKFWKKIIFRLFLLKILMVPRDIKV